MADNEVVEAIHDLTRVIIATQGQFANQSEAIRQLHEWSIPPIRIAAILAIKVNTVTSVIAKASKKKAKEKTRGEG